MSYVFALVPLHQSYTLFPYTTLFRSICLLTAGLAGCGTVRVPAGEFASDPVCAQIVMGAPEQMLEMDRVETSSQGTVAWGSGDDTVVMRCGVIPPGRSEERRGGQDGRAWRAIHQ